MLLSILPLQVVALLAAGTPVEVTLHDANHDDVYTVLIGRDGTVDADTKQVVQHAFRCRRSERERKLDRGLLAMVADIAAHYPGKTIEYVSGYRNYRGESKTSPHRAGRAIDFRIPGVKLIAVRDYAWKQFTEVGVGWYPGDDFIHVDHRPGEADIAWTERRGKNRYHPSWAKRVRRGHVATSSRTSGS